jgi:hypothetical protein
MTASPDSWQDLRATVAMLAVSSGWHVANVAVDVREVQLTLTDPDGAPMGQWRGDMDALHSLAGSLQRQAVHACRLLEAVDELDRLLTPDRRRPPVMGQLPATVAREAVTTLSGGPFAAITEREGGDDG